jgi:hypothetical protein
MVENVVSAFACFQLFNVKIVNVPFHVFITYLYLNFVSPGILSNYFGARKS